MSVVLTLAVVATWLSIIAASIGIGATFLRTFARLEPDWPSALLAAWCGLSLVFVAMVVWHFFLPLSEVAQLTFLATGALTLLRARRWVAALLRSELPRNYVLPVAAFVLWTANQALAPASGDDYLYEFQAIRWAHDYSVLPGLANLHGRFGFNNAHHLFGALLSVGPWRGGVNHLLNGLFVALAFAVLWRPAVGLLDGRISQRSVFAAALLSPCVGLVITFGPMISTLKADIMVAAIIITVSYLWIELLNDSRCAAERGAIALTAGLLSVTLLTIKISAAIFASFLILAVGGWMILHGRETRRLLAPLAFIAAMTVAAVMLRGIVLSGYPLYPATFLAANVDWRVPAGQADVERTFITTWAQMRPVYDASIPSGSWIAGWARATVVLEKISIGLPLTIVLALTPVILRRRRQAEEAEVTLAGWLVLAGASMASLIVWFLQAPSGRFALGYFWILAAAVVATCVGRPASGVQQAWPVAIAAILSVGLRLIGVPWTYFWRLLPMLGFAAAWCSLVAIAGIRVGAPARIRILMIALAVYPLADRALAFGGRGEFRRMCSLVWLDARQLPGDPVLDAVRRETRSGATVYEIRRPSYHAPLPNTPYFNPYLQLRSPSDMGRGFRNRSPLPYPLYGYQVEERTDKNPERVSPDELVRLPK